MPKQIAQPLPQTLMEPHIPGENDPVARLPYEGISHILNPVPINATLRGQLPSFDDDKEDIDLPDMTLISVKELRAEYPNSPFFKDIYRYIVKGSCSFTGNAKRVFKAEFEDYIVFEGVLFRIKLDKNKSVPPQLLLCIPETFIPAILYQYHDLVLAGHQGVLRTYLTLKQKYWFPNMFLFIRKYILSCSTCQSRKEKDSTIGAHYPRIPLSFRPMSEISADVKHMPPLRLGYSYILLCTCQVSNYVIGIPIQGVTSVTLFEAIFFKKLCLFGNPKN